MPRWEYQVFHLNVDPGNGGEPSGTAGAAPPFTQTYLEQEFPDHYKHPPAPAGAQPAAPPAKQLQDFLNGHGAQGWSLIGIFPLGPLLMMVLRRRRSEPEPPPQAPAANLENAATDRPDSDRLDTVLARLEALEQRLQSAPAAAPPPAPPPPPGLTDGSVLPAATLEALAGDAPVSAREAAEAIGYRSTASLSNLGNRSGYPAGLVKLGLNGKAAVYRGMGPASSGGKPQRHWLVVPVSRLAG